MLQQITESLTGIDIDMIHVKSHQDRDMPIDHLPIPARLNCEADKIAGAFSSQMRAPSGRALLFPAAKAILHCIKGMVTNKMTSTMVYYSTLPWLLRHIMGRNPTWTPATYVSIDWESHSKAIHTLEPYRVSLVKHLNATLPVGSRAHRLDNRYPHACPTCGEPYETDLHLYACTADTREQWRRQFLRGLRELLDEPKTPVTVMMVALEGAEAFITGDGPLLHRLRTYMVLATAQTEIGWDNFMRGRIPTAWSAAYQLCNPRDKPSATAQWAERLCTFVIQQFLLLWRARNEAQHGKDSETRAATDDAKLRRIVEYCYAHADLAPDEVADLAYRRPLHRLLEDTTMTIQAWVQNWHDLLMQYIHPVAAAHHAPISPPGLLLGRPPDHS